MAKKKASCRPTFKISQAGHLLATKGYSKAGSVLSSEGKKEKKKRRARGCLNGPPGTFRLTEKQKRNLPKHLQKAILQHHRDLGEKVYE
ncbi:MAG: hypothetical protein Q8T03_12110 [Bacteroidota bacterium]|nr:hypothetical protein [Bacteroidota bacterium]